MGENGGRWGQDGIQMGSRWDLAATWVGIDGIGLKSSRDQAGVDERSEQAGGGIGTELGCDEVGAVGFGMRWDRGETGWYRDGFWVGTGQSASVDFMDTLVTSKSGKRHIFVIINRFTKYARLVAMPETARTDYVIKLFKDNRVCDFGLPKSIVSDRDVRFTSELWKKTAEQMGSQLQMTSGNHPEANGQSKQMNRVVQHLLRHYIKPNQDDWDEQLPLIASLYNNAVHSSTGVSPNQLHLGWKPRSALDFLPLQLPTHLSMVCSMRSCCKRLSST
ncbi:hypothetical protein CBR_g51074 [Chara braunii]|uniref:Integrase catalytic domain-containing protein n=1 Tax=Chara braunii TaxID=69332 RepID=A0A388K621_CHABU|nr:hypothetical protein CBR_g51074 [Chara braunii]|eukprot:GBG65479.1 hypothetical protein CBR_g51074 [Chara braunii]